jgi:predicted ATPase
VESEPEVKQEKSFFASFFGGQDDGPSKFHFGKEAAESPPPVVVEPPYVSPLKKVRGLYLYGASGSGKTYLSSIFYEELGIKEKKKQHYNEFMLSIQNQIFRKQKVSPAAIVA